MAKRTTKRLKLTAARVRNLAPPESGRSYTFDTDVPPLAVCTTAAGRRTFYFVGRIDGRPERVKLGRFGPLTVDDARSAAKRIAGRVAAGENPQEQKRIERADLTLGEAYERFKAVPSRRTKRPKAKQTLEGYEKQYRRFLSQWSGRRLSDINREAVTKLHADITADNGPVQANRVVALLSAVYRSLGKLHDNPAHAVDRNAERSRVRALKSDEAERLFKVLENWPNADMADVMRLALFTGARRANILGMRWADLDLAEATWYIPSEDAKGCEPITPTLPPEAVAILRARKRNLDPDTPWVFPSKRSATGHIVAPNKTLAAMLEQAQIHDFRFHDQRHSAASWMANAGASLQVIARQLGHRSIATTQKYSHVDIAPVRAATSAAAAAMSGKRDQG